MRATSVTAETRLVRRNYGRNHGYKLDDKKVPGVTSVIGVLDKPALREWYARTAAERAVNEWDRLAGLPVSERLTYIQRGPREKAGAAALRGNEIHALGQALAEGRDVEVPPEHVGPVEAYARWLDAWDVETIAAETPLANTEYGYGGTADLWAKVGARGGAVCLLDIKTGKGVWNETGLQLAAYRYSTLIQPERGVEIPTPEVDLVYVAHVLPDTVRTLPVVADRDVFRDFLYVLQAYRMKERWDDWPLIGADVTPEGGDES